ncbi:MAG: prepilin-type N-terminal cleavage/methylation domain-containing protein [Planctomycetota bacterium]
MTRAGRRVSVVGFTLIELLVVLSIIVLLIGILLPALGLARSTAQQAQAMSNIRQLGAAQTLYQVDHQGHVPWGHPPNSGNLYGNPVDVKYEGVSLGGLVSARYPWRVIDYVQDVWELIYLHTDVPDRGDPFFAYNASVTPTFGNNAVYVGGFDSPFYDGFLDVASPLDHVANRGGHVIYYDHEATSPSELITFTETQASNAGGLASEGEGFYYTIPPLGKTREWEARGDEIVRVSAQAGGVPRGHFGPAASTAFFDGHAELMKPEELDDVRLWTNDADAPDDTPIP